jgi:hypothetical protein
MAVAGEHLDPSARQRVRQHLYLGRGNLALVAAEQQNGGTNGRQDSRSIDALETFMHRRGDGRRSSVDFLHDPVLERRVRALHVQPVSERLPTPPTPWTRMASAASALSSA